jgi:hypothetical protein
MTSIKVDAEYPSVATMIVSSEYDDDRQLSYIRVTNTLDDTFVNIDPLVIITELVDAIIQVEYDCL